MEMYLVIRYIDELPDDEYGVNDNYYAIGLFSNKSKAEKIKERETALVNDIDKELISIIPIEVDKFFDKGIFLGGGFYIE